jgi:Nicotinic acid phosphoribosyltransferase
VTAPLPQGQLAETRLINILHFQSLIASKAARMLLTAAGKVLVDFGLRRAHGGEAGLMAARASYLTGFAGTATVLAGERYGIPIFGTWRTRSSRPLTTRPSRSRISHVRGRTT